MSDFGIENHGTTFLLRPLTPAAVSWVKENLSKDHRQLGDAVVVEHRYIGSIVAGIQRDGLAIEAATDREKSPRKKTAKVPLEDLVRELRKVAPGQATTVSYADLLFLYEIGALDWTFAGTLCFQHLIGERGTLEEKRRLRDMKVGFSFDETKGRE